MCVSLAAWWRASCSAIQASRPPSASLIRPRPVAVRNIVSSLCRAPSLRRGLQKDFHTGWLQTMSLSSASYSEKPFRYVLHRLGQCLLHRMSFNDVFPKYIDGTHHLPDLIAAIAITDVDVRFAGRKALHRVGDGFDRPHYRSTDHNGDKPAYQAADDGHPNNDIFVLPGSKIELVADERGPRNFPRQVSFDSLRSTSLKVSSVWPSIIVAIAASV